ncbi:MAG: hypothetical protein CSA18_02590 [Deltaproteobacteria bacterium]|nr:MAG: hypothetical protein CSB21_00875 [Deltaproteobacteria bacterium]PIE75014.1 MAG: hypothetical protein CSA18_02590 [Deltaproteobacteria bacterium]
MAISIAEEIFERYIAMQDVHMEVLDNNIAKLEKDKPSISDLDYMTIQRDLIYKELTNCFKSEIFNENKEDIDFKKRLENLSYRLGFILEREEKLKNLVKENSRLLSVKLGKMRKGQTALSAYNRTAENL